MADEVNELPEMVPQPVDAAPVDAAPVDATPVDATPVDAAEEPVEEAAEETTDAPTTDAPVEEGALAAGLTLGGEAAEGSEEESEAVVTPAIIRGHIDKFGVAWGTGRRKTSVARVRVREGKGTVTINGRNVDEYFHKLRDQITASAPLQATNMADSVDVIVNVKGGGTTGQAGAVMLGVARALQALNPELHETLASGHFLTRDSRMVERKKYGYKKARKSFQFSKR